MIYRDEKKRQRHLARIDIFVAITYIAIFLTAVTFGVAAI